MVRGYEVSIASRAGNCRGQRGGGRDKKMFSRCLLLRMGEVKDDSFWHLRKLKLRGLYSLPQVT